MRYDELHDTTSTLLSEKGHIESGAKPPRMVGQEASLDQIAEHDCVRVFIELSGEKLLNACKAAECLLPCNCIGAR